MYRTGTLSTRSSHPTSTLRAGLAIVAMAATTAIALATGSALAAPVRGGAANIAMIGEPQTLDPMASTADLVGIITQHIYELLYTFDANWNVTPMLAEGEKPVALAHSMGAHILLRHLVRKPASFAASVLSAPMIAISFRGQREFLVRAVTRYHMWRGKHAGWVWGMEARDPHRVTFAGQLVTSDPQRFERTQSFLRERPELRLAGATWGWLAAALRAMDWLKGQAACITTPLLLVGAGKDRICVTRQTKAFASRLPQAEYVEIAQAEHEILMERSPIRAEFWAAFDSYMKRHHAPA